MVGRLIQEQKRRSDIQCPSKCNTHPPATREMLHLEHKIIEQISTSMGIIYRYIYIYTLLKATENNIIRYHMKCQISHHFLEETDLSIMIYSHTSIASKIIHRRKIVLLKGIRKAYQLTMKIAYLARAKK